MWVDVTLDTVNLAYAHKVYSCNCPLNPTMSPVITDMDTGTVAILSLPNVLMYTSSVTLLYTHTPTERNI